jgi:hypothetical protein
MIRDFVNYEGALALKELGFDEPCFGYYEPNGDFDYIEKDIIKDFPYLAKNSEWQDLVASPTFSQCFRWFREKYDLHVQIRKENHVYRKVHCNYFHFDISKGEQNDITKQQDLYSNIMDECEQDIPGNYLDNEKLNILIFEKGFAFNTYEEVEIECLKKLIEILKEKK